MRLLCLLLFGSLALVPTTHSASHSASEPTALGGQAAGFAAPTRAPDFLAIPGVRALSGRLIARPLQVRALAAEGLDRAAIGARRTRARRTLASLEVLRHEPATDDYLVRVPLGDREESVAAALMASGDFEYAEPDWLLSPLCASLRPQSGASALPGASLRPPQSRPACPDDPIFPAQWHHASDRLDSCAAWGRHRGGASVSIGVCDTGLRVTHEDLQLHRLEGYNAVDRLWESEGGDISPIFYHGTRTTGVVAANGDNGLGVVGVGWNFSHRMLRVSNLSDGGAYLSDLQHGARTSIESGDRVANVSYHGASSASNAATATYIKNLGGLLLWGAGNTSSNYSHADRDADDLIVVGATNQADTLAYFSSYGTFIDLVAPGVGITTTDSGSDSDYATADGTSYACPLTAGLCALLWSERPNLSPDDVERIIKASADDVGSAGIDSIFGYGRINLASALRFDASAQPSAKLHAEPESGLSPLVVDFRDLSSGLPSAWSWDFGDGATSDQQFAQHTYASSGRYDVSLTVTNALGTDQTTVVDAVLVDVIPPLADFSASTTAGLSPLAVDFTDESTGGIPTSWLWDFGDGGSSNLAQPPTHVYTSSGFYTVSLTVANAFGSDQLTRTNYIAVDFIAPVAAFSGTPTAGNSPFVVQFSDESGGGVATTWLWYFGDGFSSTAQNPAHTYAAPGSYSVRLEAGNAYGSDLLWRYNYIDVGPGGPVLADFVGAPLSGSAPLQVSFTDLSIGTIESWEWDFGDGGTSTLQNPVHTFATPGEYDVALQVNHPLGQDSQLERPAYIVVR